jgi:NAD(P)-dependent dehydrogenase (short-subunit alcohol dehydrogenase family)
MSRFAGKVAIVFGGSGGVGNAITRRLLSEGAQVSATYRSRPANVGTSDDDQVSRAVLPVRADVTRDLDVQAVYEQTLDCYGQVDIVISTVGATSQMTLLVDTEPADIDQTIAVELRGSIRLVQAALPHLRDRGGRIVLVGSDSGRVGALGEATSAACRAGIIAMAKSVAREHAREGILINVVCPGPIDTALWQQLLQQDDPTSQRAAQGLLRSVPMRRPATVEEVASGVLYLASPEASFITGQALSVSGGLTMVS